LKHSLHALSVIQPWAHIIVFKGKNVENRTVNYRMRGFFAIHASAKYDAYNFSFLKNYRLKLSRDELDFGAIIGFAELVDVITRKQVKRNTQRWFTGKYGLVLKNIIPLKLAVPAKGSLGFWPLKGAALNKCLSQLSQRKQKMILDHPLS